MSDNKIVDTLQFDDDIDFDGLDEYDESETEMPESVSESVNENVAEDEDVQSFSDSVDIEEELHSESEAALTDDFAESDNEPFEIDANSISVQDFSSEIRTDTVSNTLNNSDKFVRRFCVINTIAAITTLCVLGVGVFYGCKYISSMQAEIDEKNTEIAELQNKNNMLEADFMAVMNTVEEEETDTVGIPETEIEQGKILFYDSSVGYSWIPVISGIKQNTYDKENFSVDDRYRMTYTVDEEESSYFGIDVSSYQGDIDWQLVKEDGVEFAILRIGYRGYGAEGKLCPDEYFVQNYEAAHDAGIDLGVYFFSQATSVAEAVEEAEFVLSLLENRPLEYPIVFDWENIYTGDPEDIPRTDDMMPQTLTLSAIAFCETVKDAGYEAMIYTNKKLATIKYDLRQLSDYPVWLAYYNTELDYYYDFDIWQYGTGQVDGIEGEVDVNIAIIR